MLSVGEDVEADALSKRGWTISAIARHLGRDRKTVRAYLSGERTPGVRRADPSRPAGRLPRYVTARFADDPHLWATAAVRRGRRPRVSPARTRASPARSAWPGCARTARRARG